MKSEKIAPGFLNYDVSTNFSGGALESMCGLHPIVETRSTYTNMSGTMPGT